MSCAAQIFLVAVSCGMSEFLVSFSYSHGSLYSHAYFKSLDLNCFLKCLMDFRKQFKYGFIISTSLGFQVPSCGAF